MRLFRLILMIAAIFLCVTPVAHAKSHWLTGGLIGAGVGVAAGTGIPFVACGLAEENTGDCRAIGIPAGAVVMGAAGFGIGALIGRAFKKDDVGVGLLVDPLTGTYGVSMTKSF